MDSQSLPPSSFYSEQVQFADERPSRFWKMNVVPNYEKIKKQHICHCCSVKRYKQCCGSVAGNLPPVEEGEPSFHLFGFIMCVGATAARALKSVVQGIWLSSEGEKLNSMNLWLYMAPIAVVLLLPATLYMEGDVVAKNVSLARLDIMIIWILLFNSMLVCFVNLTNFFVTKHTSALTLQVLGNARVQ